jgi:hypothetical protein
MPLLCTVPTHPHDQRLVIPVLLDGPPHFPLLQAFEHRPSPSRSHLVGCDVNDHVASQRPLSLCLSMIPRFVVSQVSHKFLVVIYAEEGREGRLG